MPHPPAGRRPKGSLAMRQTAGVAKASSTGPEPGYGQVVAIHDEPPRNGARGARSTSPSPAQAAHYSVTQKLGSPSGGVACDTHNHVP